MSATPHYVPTNGGAISSNQRNTAIVEPEAVIILRKKKLTAGLAAAWLATWKGSVRGWHLGYQS